MKNYYETLSISPSTTTEQIKIAYTNAVLKIQGQPNFAFRFAEIQDAYDILSSPVTRKAFDEELLKFYTGSFTNVQTKAPKPEPQKQTRKAPQSKQINPIPIYKDLRFITLTFVVATVLVILLKAYFDNQPTETVTAIPQTTQDLPSIESENNKLKENESAPIVAYPPPVIEPIPVPVESPFKGKHLSNGSSPFDECFGQGDYSGRASLLVKNGTSNEAIICLYDVNSGITIRNEYVRKNASYSLSNIPQGSYNIRVLYGNDWNPNAPSPCGSNGFFDSDIDFSEKDGSVFFSDNESGTTRATYTLYAVVGGNSKSSKIDKSKFFRK